MRYCTVVQVKAREEVAGKLDSDYEVAIDWAADLIDKITGDYFESKSLTLRLNGSGIIRQNLYPATLLRCLSVISARDVSTNTIISSTYYLRYDRYLIMIEPITIRAEERTQLWPVGVRSLEVIGTFGWEETPSPIREAAILVSLKKLKTTGVKSTLTGDKVSERMGDYSYSKGKEEKMGISTGISEVDKVLEMYQNRFIALGAV